jgi:hypothetical protein
MVDQLADPLGIPYVGLTPRDVSQMLGVQEPQLELDLEHVVDLLPVNPRRFHADQLDLEGGQSVSQPEQILGRGGGLSDLLVVCAPLPGDSDAGCD